MVQIIISKVQFFFFIRKETYQVGPVWSTLVYPVYFGPFDLLRSLQSNLVHLVYSGPIQSTSVYSVHICRILYIQSILSGQFGPIRYIYLRNEKDKIWLRVLSIIWVISIVIIE